jgi:hypothetical protein
VWFGAVPHPLRAHGRIIIEHESHDALAAMAGDAFGIEDGQRHRKIVPNTKSFVRDAVLEEHCSDGLINFLKLLRPVNIGMAEYCKSELSLGGLTT